MKIKLLPTLISTCVIFSAIAVAGMADIKNSYTPSNSINDNFSASPIQPGYQLDTAPTTNWKPQVNLDNATGKPTIDLGNSYGSISGTTGVNGDISDSIGSGGGGEPTFGKWVKIWYKAANCTGDLNPYPVSPYDNKIIADKLTSTCIVKTYARITERYGHWNHNCSSTIYECR